MKITPTRVLAIEIAATVFTIGGTSQVAERISLMRGDRAVCGWSIGPLTDAIERVIKNHPRVVVGPRRKAGKP